MHSGIAMHQPKVKTDLPAHEQAARRRRAADAQLPGIPGRPLKRPEQPEMRPGGRKTLDLNLPNLRH